MFRAAITLGTLMLAPLHAPAEDELLLTDPMRPYLPAQPQVPRVAAPGGPTLSAVLISAERRIAIIDGKFYREGDEVGGARLISIDADSVQLRRDGQDIELRLRAGNRRPQTTQGDSAS